MRKQFDERDELKSKLRRSCENYYKTQHDRVTFTFNGQTYIQVEGVMMGSPLGPVFANIFMCELENYLIPKLGDKISNWSRYVDDTFAFIKPQYIYPSC